MAKQREKTQLKELSSAFHKKAEQELVRLRTTVAENLRKEMISLLEDEIHTDLLFTNGITSVRAHKCVVQARCRHLWKENWLTYRPDPDNCDQVLCLDMPALSGGKLIQFVRQMYSVSDTALLLEEYIDYMPGGTHSTSSVDPAFDQSDTVGSSGSPLIKLEGEIASSKVEIKNTELDLRSQQDNQEHTRSCILDGQRNQNEDKTILPVRKIQATSGIKEVGKSVAVACHVRELQMLGCSVSNGDTENSYFQTSPRIVQSLGSCSPPTDHGSENMSKDQLMDSLLTPQSAFKSQGTSINFCRDKELSSSEHKLASLDANVDHENRGEQLQACSEELLLGKISTADVEQSRQLSPDKDLMTSNGSSLPYTTCSELGRDVLTMYLQEMCCDCCLSVQGVHFMAHKCVLSARSEYFLAMFGGQWSESKLATVNLEAVSPQAVKQLLLFLYGGVTDLCAASNMKELFIIADMYGVLTFRTVLMFYVKKDLCHFFHKPCPVCVVSMSEALSLCQKFHLEDLQARCLHWMAKYFTKIWPTKSFSVLEDSSHQLCLQTLLAQMTASNVLEIVMECTKLISSLPRIKWTENILCLVTRLMDSAIEYTSAHFMNVLKTKEFLLWAKVASWKASALEEILYSVIDSLPVDTACLVFQTLTKLQDFHSNPDNPEPEIACLLEALIRRCEKYFRTHIHHIMRSRQWSMLLQPVQARILELSAYVYIPSSAANMPLKQSCSVASKVQSCRTLAAGSSETCTVAGTSSATARAGMTIKTSSLSGRQTNKSQSESRMSRSLPRPHKKGEASIKYREAVIRGNSKNTLWSTSKTGPPREVSKNGTTSWNPEPGSKTNESQMSTLSNLEGHVFPQNSKAEEQASPVGDTVSEDISLEIHHKVKKAETIGSVSQTDTLTFSCQSRSGSCTKSHLPVGQKSHLDSAKVKIKRDKFSQSKHLVSKLPALIRLPRPAFKHESTVSTVDGAIRGIHLEDIKLSTCPPSQVRSSNDTADKNESNRDVDFVSEFVQMMSDDASVTCADVEPTCMSIVNLAISSENLANMEESPGSGENLMQLSQMNDNLLTDNLHKITSMDERKNSLGNFLEQSEAGIGRYDNSSKASNNLQTAREDQDDHMNFLGKEIQPEVRIVHMSKTLNVGFIVPPD